MKNSKETIETKDLTIKKASIDDADKFYKDFLTKRESLEFADIGEYSTAEEFKKDLQKCYFSSDSTEQLWLVFEKEQDTIIGYVDFGFSSKTKCESVGIFLSKKCTHKGYGTQIMQAMLEHLKSTGVKVVDYCCDDTNIASQKLAKKLGFKFVNPRKTKKGSVVYDYTINL